MSERNLDVVREAFTAFNRGDLEAAGGVLHPEAEWHPYLGAVEGNLYRGREAILEMWRGLEEGFGGSLRVELRELIAVGDARVVAVVEAHGTGSGSGAEVRQAWAQVATLREGQIARVEAFADREAALEAAARR